MYTFGIVLICIGAFLFIMNVFMNNLLGGNGGWDEFDRFFCINKKQQAKEDAIAISIQIGLIIVGSGIAYYFR